MDLNRTRWPIFGALVCGILAVAGLWYFVLSNPKGEAVPASGGRYTEGVVGAPSRINPLFAGANAVDRDLTALIFSGLVRLSPDGTPLPDLAERWEITGNGTGYVFHLREGVAWQDDASTPLTAEDVVFTFDAIADPAFRGDATLAQFMQGVVVTARDPRTVEFRLEQAYAPFLAYLDVGILPRHILGDLDADELFNAEFNARPIGSGPYRFQSRSRNAVTMSSNATYHFGPPKVSTFELRLFPDETSLAAAVHDGDVDGALLGPLTPDDEIAALRDDARFALHELVPTAYHIVYLDTRTPLFEDARVRRALMQGVNVQTLLNDVAGGRGLVADTGIPVDSWAYTPIESPPFDPGAAARSLEAAGWPRARDGIRRNGDLRLAFTLSTSNEPRRVALAENIAQQWHAIGADVEVVALAANTYVEEVLLGRDFQAALAEIDPGPDPDPYPFWHTTQIAPPGRNLASFSDPTLDDVLERARQTTDSIRRKELYQLYEGTIVGATPSVPLYHAVYVYAQDTGVQGFAPSLLFTPASRFHNVFEWYVKTRVQRD